jgi:hypothetical protein
LSDQPDKKSPYRAAAQEEAESLAHLASDVQAETMAEIGRRIDELMPEHVHMRTKDQVTAFFGGMPLDEPGVVLTHQCRPDIGAAGAGGVLWAGVARKP